MGMAIISNLIQPTKLILRFSGHFVSILEHLTATLSLRLMRSSQKRLETFSQCNFELFVMFSCFIFCCAAFLSTSSSDAFSTGRIGR